MSARVRLSFGALGILLFAVMSVTALTAMLPGSVPGRGLITQANRPPWRPVNLEPRNGAYIKAVGACITLRASAFRDTNPPVSANGRQRGSQWVIKAVATGAVVVDSGFTTRCLNAFPVRSSVLQTSVTYNWSVRYADASAKRDTMWSSWSLPTSFLILPSVIKELTPATIQQGVVKPGELVYADKLLPVIVSAPAPLLGNPWLRTLDADAKSSGPGTLISFKSDLPCKVVVAYDDRATTLPQWLWSYHLVTNKGGKYVCVPNRIKPPKDAKILVLDRTAPLRRLLVKSFGTTQTVELGKNLPAPSDTTVTLKMYSVVVVPNYKGVLPMPTPTPRPTPKPARTPCPTPKPKPRTR